MRLLRHCSIATGLLLAASAAALAQSAVTVSGKVTNEAGAALPGASVFLQGLNVGAQTNDDGRYSFVVSSSRATGQTVPLSARSIGYSVRSISVTLTPGSAIVQNFALGINPLRLGEVVVTGAGTSTTREKLSYTINSIDSSALRRATEPQNLVAALTAKAPNVVVRMQSGEPGASASIQIRGSASLTGTNQPLFVVDGQPIDNQTNSTASGMMSGADVQGGTATSNRASDINPNDIESIDILKGAAASAIYGARAANGVVLITTKRGRPGTTRLSVSSTSTVDHASTPSGMLQTDYAQGDLESGIATSSCAGADCRPSRYSWGAKLPAGTPTFDHLNEVFDTGHTFDNNVQLSGGNERTTYFASGGVTNQDGVVIGPNNKYNRATFRLKGTQTIGSSLNVSGNFSYIDARGNYVQHGNDVSGLLLGEFRTPPTFNNAQYLTPGGLQRAYRFPDASSITAFNGAGYYDNPYWLIFTNSGNRSELGRSVSNFNADWNPLGWLNVKETVGGDYYNDSRVQALPLTSASDKVGNVARVNFNNLEIDNNLLVTATGARGPNLNATITVGQNLNSRRFRQLVGQGEGLIAPAPLALPNTSTQTATEFKSLRHIEGYFAQGELDLFNQLYLTAGVRNDGFSTFGASQRRHSFPKASAAWTFTNAFGNRDQKGLLSFGKLRLAYGETGKEPAVYAAVNALSSATIFGSGFGDIIKTSINGVGGLTSSTQLGNSSLRPERSRETEFGGDFGFFDQRADLSITGYDKRSSDVILPITVNSGSTGFTTAYKNAASLTNRGVEISLNLRPVTMQNFAWDIGVQYGRNKGNVTSLGGAALFDLGEGFGIGTAEGVDALGYAPGVIGGHDFVRCGRGLNVDLTGAGSLTDIDALCAATPGGYKKNALYLGPDGLPVLDNTTRVIADPHPKYTMSYNSSIKLWNSLRLSGLLDLRKGGSVYDGTRGALYVFGTHKDTDVRSRTGTYGKDWETDIYPDVAGPGKGVVAFKSPTDWEDWFVNNEGGGFGDVQSQFVEDGSFVKLRELSLTYTVTRGFVRSLTGFSSADLRVAGRNLKTWTRYRGLDPEVNNAGAEFLTQGLDWFANPQTRSFVVSISLNR